MKIHKSNYYGMLKTAVSFLFILLLSLTLPNAIMAADVTDDTDWTVIENDTTTDATEVMGNFDILAGQVNTNTDDISTNSDDIATNATEITDLKECRNVFYHVPSPSPEVFAISTTTYLLNYGFDPEEADTQILMPRDGTISNIHVAVSTNNLTTAELNVVVRINGSDSSVVASVSPGTTGTINSGSLSSSYSAGDKLNVVATVESSGAGDINVTGISYCY